MNLPTPEKIAHTKLMRKLRLDIQTVLRALVDPEFTAPLDKPSHRALIFKFYDCLALPDEDVGRFPYWTGTDRASKPKKIDCVLAIVSCVITGYWLARFTESKFNIDVIEHRLDQLRYIVEHWDKLEVQGDVRSKYFLNIPGMEEPKNEQIETGQIRPEETTTETD